MRRSTRARTAVGRAGASLAVLLVVAAAFFGGRESMASISRDTSAASSLPADHTVWTVKEESIGRTLTFSGTIETTTVSGPMANSAGIVTDVGVGAMAAVDVGDPLYAVALRPTVAGVGAVPAFRALAEGAEGADVAQLRGFLCSTGFLTTCSVPGDTFTPAVTRAVKAWQKSLDLPEDGTVGTSDIMWFPALPVQVQPSETLAVGSRLTEDDRPLLIVSGAPVLTVEVSKAQGDLVPVGSRVTFGQRSAGLVAGISPAPSDTGESEAVRISVVGDDGATEVCSASDECPELLGGTASTTLDVAVEVIPALDGVGVPVQAVLTEADDSTYVMSADGSHLPVTVVGSSGGIALVDGLAVGDEIQVSGAAGA